MVNRKKMQFKHRGRQQGQSMTEYIIVLAAILGLYALTPMKDEISNLETAINNKSKGYAYGISLSDYPDAENVNDLINHYPALSDRRDKIQKQIDKVTDTRDRIDALSKGEIDLPDSFNANGMPDIDLSKILRNFI